MTEAMLKRKADALLAKQREEAFEERGRMQRSDRRWDDRTVGDVTTLQICAGAEAEIRADKAMRGAGVLVGLVMVPGESPSIEAWEAEAKQLSARGQQVIDTTAGPVTPVKAGE